MSALNVNCCITECKAGSYGINCGASCGSCKSGTVCGRVNGACVQGCDPGYTGTICKQGDWFAMVKSMKILAVNFCFAINIY